MVDTHAGASSSCCCCLGAAPALADSPGSLLPREFRGFARNSEDWEPHGWGQIRTSGGEDKHALIRLCMNVHIQDASDQSGAFSSRSGICGEGGSSSGSHSASRSRYTLRACS